MNSPLSPEDARLLLDLDELDRARADLRRLEARVVAACRAYARREGLFGLNPEHISRRLRGALGLGRERTVANGS